MVKRVAERMGLKVSKKERGQIIIKKPKKKK
jgi:hypothetical protein